MVEEGKEEEKTYDKNPPKSVLTEDLTGFCRKFFLLSRSAGFARF